jgi:hypothetical protein
MPINNTIEFNITGIGGILKDQLLEVPLYQRSYAWEKKHVEDLYTDLSSAIREGRDEYFLGSVVLLESGDQKHHVVDGQQRLATCTILIAAIRDYFEEEGDQDRATDFERTYLILKDRRSQSLIANLKLNSIDNDFFLNYVLTYRSVKERKKIKADRESHKKIKNAADIARRFIRRLAGVTKNPFNDLIDWLDFLDAQAKVIRVQVPDGANAFTIFETLNDRGLELAISDLLKNFIFNKSGERISEAQQSWSTMTGALSTAGAEKQTIAYIRHVWSTQEGLTRERELYESIKSRVISEQAAINIANLFGECSSLYAAILNPNHEIWRKYGVTARKSMQTLNLLRMTQVRPLILSILKKFGTADVAKSMKLLVSFSVRFYILGKLGSGDLEHFYANKARDISNGKIDSYDTLRTLSLKEVPTDTQFEGAFASAQVGKNYLARYYLLTLQNASYGKGEIERLANDNPDEVDLEHILPQNPSESWCVDEHYLETHTNRLGNLALLLASENSHAGNADFQIKKEHYAKSQLSLTAGIAEYDNWSEASIEARQAELANLAVKAWPL